MGDGDGFHPLRGLFALVRSLVLLAVVAVAVVAVVGFRRGWITYNHDEQQNTTTIEIETGKLKQATRDAVERGREAVENVGEGLRQHAGDGAESPNSWDNAGKDSPESE